MRSACRRTWRASPICRRMAWGLGQLEPVPGLAVGKTVRKVLVGMRSKASTRLIAWSALLGGVRSVLLLSFWLVAEMALRLGLVECLVPGERRPPPRQPGTSLRPWPPRPGTGTPGQQPTHSRGRPSMRRRSAPASWIMSTPRSATTATPRRSPRCCTGSTSGDRSRPPASPVHQRRIHARVHRRTRPRHPVRPPVRPPARPPAPARCPDPGTGRRAVVRYPRWPQYPAMDKRAVPWCWGR